ncbi:MAG: hypothetical protein R3E66_09505 [bacterium]
MKAVWMILMMSLLAAPVLADEGTLAASSTDGQDWRVGIGARVGGYGFRQVNDEGNIDFENCRMDGTGLFFTSEFGEHIYTELAFDFYHTTAEPTRNGIDRLSLHSTLAAGIKFFPGHFITPNVHFGAGAEFTKAELYGTKQNTIAPVGFIGVGGELNFGDLKAGMAIRSNAMQLPEYDWTTQNDVQWHTEVAGQALFWVRYVL